jgi:hypothetical protein
MNCDSKELSLKKKLQRQSNREKQRRFRQRMYDKGFVQKIIWVERERLSKINEEVFFARIREITVELSKTAEASLYKKLLNTAKDYIRSMK